MDEEGKTGFSSYADALWWGVVRQKTTKFVFSTAPVTVTAILPKCLMKTCMQEMPHHKHIYL